MQPTELTIAGARLRRPRELALGLTAWSAWTAAVAAMAASQGWLHAEPERALCVAVTAGALASRPRRLWWAPLVLALTLAAGWLVSTLGLSPVMAGGAVGGWWVVRASDLPADGLDRVNGALAGAALAGLGLWLAGLVPLASATGATVAGAVLGGLAGLAQLPHALIHPPALPRRRVVEMTLAEAYRDRPLKALRLLRTIRAAGPDAGVRERLVELVVWVYRLALAIQTLDQELEEVDELAVRERIAALREQVEGASDGYTRERLEATADHLDGLLDHARRLGVERRRLASLQDCAMASLEEARLGVALSRTFPGQRGPDGLDEVLAELREQARDVGRERATGRELAQVPSY